MNNDPETIQALLDPHGYQIWCDETGCAYECQEDELAGEAASDYAHDPASLQDACNAALAHFLNDASRDADRMADMIGIETDLHFSWTPEGIVCRPAAGPYAAKWLPAPTIREAINRFWLCIHDLDDPRKEETHD